MNPEKNVDLDSFIKDVINANQLLINAVCELENVIHKFKLAVHAQNKGGANDESARH